MDWYYVENDLRMGPVSEEEFENLVGVGRILPETLVWQTGMAEWLPYSEATSGGAAPASPEPDGESVHAPHPQQELGGAQAAQNGGAWIADSAANEKIARQSGAQQNAAFHLMPVIPNYLVQSIIATLCCCTPLGIVAIVFAAQVNGFVAAGDVEGARNASNKAKMFCWIAFSVGILWLAFVVFGQMLPLMYFP